MCLYLGRRYLWWLSIENIFDKSFPLQLRGLGEELGEHFLCLEVAAVADQLFDVDPARPDEGGVQPVRVVRGEEGQPRLTRHHAVQRVEEAGQGRPLIIATSNLRQSQVRRIVIIF